MCIVGGEVCIACGKVCIACIELDERLPGRRGDPTASESLDAIADAPDDCSPWGEMPMTVTESRLCR